MKQDKSNQRGNLCVLLVSSGIGFLKFLSSPSQLCLVLGSAVVAQGVATRGSSYGTPTPQVEMKSVNYIEVDESVLSIIKGDPFPGCEDVASFDWCDEQNGGVPADYPTCFGKQGCCPCPACSPTNYIVCTTTPAPTPPPTPTPSPTPITTPTPTPTPTPTSTPTRTPSPTPSTQPLSQTNNYSGYAQFFTSQGAVFLGSLIFRCIADHKGNDPVKKASRSLSWGSFVSTVGSGLAWYLKKTAEVTIGPVASVLAVGTLTGVIRYTCFGNNPPANEPLLEVKQENLRMINVCGVPTVRSCC